LTFSELCVLGSCFSTRLYCSLLPIN